jgi:type VI secretion system protein ImpG
VEERVDDLHNGLFLIVRMPEALLKPVKLVLEGLWHQPGFAREAVGKLRITLPNRSQDGFQFQPISDVRAHAASALGQDSMALLRLLAMRMKSVLNARELGQLLAVLGTVSDSPFRDMAARIKGLSVELAPDSALRGSGLRHVYRLTFDRFEPDEESLVWTFLQQITCSA